MRVSYLVSAASVLRPLQCSARWLGIPTVPFEPSVANETLSLKTLSSIIVDSKYEKTVDTAGETLIPPTLMEFASTFSEDLSSILSLNVSVKSGNSTAKNAIFMTIGTSSAFVDAAGRRTSEGYSIDVTSTGIVITGSSPLGAFWATRSILQQGVLGDMSLSLGKAIDAPGWGVRGTFLDAGRHYYPPDFITELCAYLSFFKQNTLHLHLSDSPGVLDTLTMEEKLSFYSAFRPNSPDPAVAGLNHRPNESYYQSDFETMQQSCASRGVTIIPEIEAPGHAIVITQWKPELALSTDFTMLNISYPDTIPTLQTVWSTFLPWFHSKTVHLGADEYSSAEVQDYNDYVNTMYNYIGTKYGKAVRIWGTFVPGIIDGEVEVNTNVSIQHWEYFEANPYYDFIKNGYSVLNSDDQFYVVNKWSGSYPQTINVSRIFHGAPDGGPTAPNIFDRTNSSNNPPRNSPYVLGQLPALWNDFGPNATSVIEAYYALKDGLPALGDKQWGGDILEEEYWDIFPILLPRIPGQNLERTVPSKTDTIFNYQFSRPSSNSTKTGVGAVVVVEDESGNGYHGSVVGSCTVSNSTLILKSGCGVSTPLTTKGRNYTLSFSVKPASSTPGTLFTGSASELKAGNGSLSNMMLVTGGNAYVLNYTLPVGSWTDVSLVGINNATYLSVTPGIGNATETVYEFTITIGDLSNSFIWGNPMAIEAPIATIGGGTFVGEMKSVVLKNGADARYASIVEPLVIGVAPYT